MSFFTGKTAIVTGAGSGIGRELALQLAEKGCRLAITDISEKRIQAVAEEVKKLNARCSYYIVDHSEPGSTRGFAADFFKDFSHVDILCLNAGVGVGGPALETTIEDWEWVMSVNVHGNVYMLDSFLKPMTERMSGSILFTASGAGLIGIPGMSAYCSSKFAVVGMAESLRAELKEYNIGVSTLCPGLVKTNILNDARLNTGNGDESNHEARSIINAFYDEYGSTADRVAADGLKAVEKNIGVMVSPVNVYAPWLTKRFSEDIYSNAASLLYSLKKF